MHVYMYVCMHACMHVCMYVCMYVCADPIAARSKAWVCGRSLAAIVGPNPAGGMGVSCECCVL